MKQWLMTAVAAATLASTPWASACTDFRLTAQDGTILVTRSMEFAIDMKANLRTSPRGRLFSTTAPDGKPGMTWKAKYGYLYFDGMGADLTIDGMNEQGLSFEALLFPGFAQYQTAPANQDSKVLPYLYIGDWALSNFKTVDEVRQALNNIFVVSANFPGMANTVLPAHFSFFDASGKGLIAEYVGGKLYLHDSIGIFTNSPTYEWHVTNLRNYVNLKPTNPNPVTVNGLTFAATGQGSGMVGLPGDASPPSRFVKTAILTAVATPATNATEELNLAEHIINNVDIMKGLAREQQTGNYTNDITQWVDFKDLTHKKFYYRTYDNMTLRSVSFDKLDFSENAPKLKMPIENGANIQDVTSQFLGQKL